MEPTALWNHVDSLADSDHVPNNNPGMMSQVSFRFMYDNCMPQEYSGEYLL